MSDHVATDPASILEGGLVLDQDGTTPVGMELSDPLGLLWSTHLRGGYSMRASRDPHGIRLSFSHAGQPSPAHPGSPSEGREVPRFARIVRVMRSASRAEGTDAGQFTTRCNVAVGTGRIPGMTRADRETFAHQAREVLSQVLARVEPFLATLDQAALAIAGSLSREHLSLGEYSALDATFQPEAPLGRALAWHPHLASALLEARRRDPRRFDDAVARGDDALRELFVGGPPVDVICTGGGHRGSVRVDPGLSWRFAALMDGLDPTLSRKVEVEVRCTQMFGDAAVHAAEWLWWLPRSWFPRDGAQALALALCGPAIETALSVTDVPEEVARILNVGGDWAGLLARFRAVIGRDAELETALDDVSDLAKAYARQVLAPAVALTGGSPASVLTGDAMRALLGEGTLRRLLEISRRWHSREARMHEELPVDPGGRRGETWPAALPDATYGDLTVVVLTDGRQLREEGRALDHCVGGYGPECLEGRSRIVSVRRSVDGVVTRLSTAELSWERADGGPPDVSQHLGPHNSVPPPLARAALDRYVDDLSSGVHVVDEDALAPVPGGDPAVREAGYDWRVPGSWERVVDLWDPVLPRSLRGLSLAGAADLAARCAKGVRPDPPPDPPSQASPAP